MAMVSIHSKVQTSLTMTLKSAIHSSRIFRLIFANCLKQKPLSEILDQEPLKLYVYDSWRLCRRHL